MTGANAPRLNVHRGGRGEPLVLIHGIGLTLRSWVPVLPALEAAHDVIAVDLPGFGESPPLPAEQPSTVLSLTDAVERLLEDSGLSTVHVAGNSLGGWIAAELARRGRARSVVALSPAGIWTRREHAYATASLRLHRWAAERIAPHATALTRTRAGRTAFLSTAMARPWRLDPGEAAYMFRAFASAPGWHRTLEWTSANRAAGLEEIRCPVRIAWGTLDTLLPPRQGPRCARGIPGAELCLLPRLGHVPMSDDPELVARTITDFTGRVDRGAARPGTTS